MYSAKAVANYFLRKASENGKSLTPLQVIKLVYLAQGWYLAYFKESLINENVEAWKFGPVIGTIYHEFKAFQDKPITLYATEFEKNQGIVVAKGDFTDEQQEILNAIWESYGDWTGPQLTELTHRKGTPWYVTYHEKGGKEEVGKIIDNDLIKDHYSHLAETRHVAL